MVALVVPTTQRRSRNMKTECMFCSEGPHCKDCVPLEEEFNLDREEEQDFPEEDQLCRGCRYYGEEFSPRCDECLTYQKMMKR